MTTFQGPPPQSRRAARESERAAQGTSDGVDYAAFIVPEQQAPEAQPSDAEREQQESSLPRPGGRRAQRPEGGPEAEPVTYSTQIPSYDGPSFSRTAPQSTEAPADSADAPFRVRDFSPEGRRAAQSPSAQAAELDYHTQAGPPASPWQPPVVDAAPVQQPDAPTPSPRPMTRRELRALEQQRAEAAAALVEPPEASQSAAALSNAIAEFEALTKAGLTGSIPIQAPAATSDPFAGLMSAPGAEQQVEAPAPVTEPAPAVEAHDDWNTVDAPHELHEVPDAATPAAFPFSLLSPAAAVEPAPSDSVAEATSPETDEVPVWARETQPWSPEQRDDAVDEVDQDVDHEGDSSEPQVTRESYTPPPGHWSRQAELDDDLPYETTMGRGVGSSNLATTTSALILPSIPQSDFSTLINGTGEILITGTIELPSSLGTMGADARHFDNPDVDHMFDAFDKELVSNDSQPVRAIRAVSTHTATRGIVQINTKPPTNRLTTVAIVVASVLAAGVVGLLAFFIINNLG